MSAAKKKKKILRAVPLAELKREYDDLRPRLDKLEEEIHHQLKQLLPPNVLALSFPIQRRVKEWASIAEKLERVRVSIDHVKDMQDLVGFRIILQFQRDLERVCSLISENFTLIRRYDTGERLREDQFGYSSIHFVVQVPDGWLTVPTMKELAGLQAEIQVRTTAQHIWAEASKVLQYKNENSVPPSLRRAIYRVSALLETVDLELERVLSAREDYVKSLEESTALSTDVLNVDILQRVASDSWPANNKDDREDWSNLLVELQHVNVNTAERLRKVLGKWRDLVLKEDAEVVKRISSGDTDSYDADDKGRLRAGVYYTHAGLTRGAMKLEFGKQYTDFQKSFYSKLSKEHAEESTNSTASTE